MKDKSLNILFRCDSSVDIGLGHVMRCLVLAKRLLEQNRFINITFATQNLKGNINHQILENKFKIYTLKSNKKAELIDLINKEEISLLVIDSYKIGSRDEKKIVKYIKCKILVFDDTFQKHYADMILNHGIQVKKKRYKHLIPKASKLFCGSKYTLLRDEFFKNYNSKCNNKSIAIILGGNDSKNLSLKISKLLHKIDKKYKITIITTEVNQHIDELKKHKEITLLIDIDNIAYVLSKQEFVICASGGTLFEVMALKKSFINIQVATNQASIVEFLEKKNIYTSLDIDNINKTSLTTKINYIMNHKIYNKMNLKFSKYNLAKKILNELK